MALIPEEKKQTGKQGFSFKSFIISLLSWFYGVSALIVSIVMLVDEEAGFFVALPLFFIALLLLPPMKKFIKLNFKSKAILIIALFVIAVQASSIKSRQQAVQDFYKKSAQIYSEIREKITTKAYQEAIDLTSEYLKIVNDDTLIALQNQAKAEKAELEKKEEVKKLVAEVKQVPASDYYKNMSIYKKLAELEPDNKTYASKLEYYTEKYNAKLAEEAAKEERRKMIEQQFSAWDGSHINLTRHIKKYMNDPKSYQHVETVYWDRGDHLIVRTTFRGKNAFGGLVLNSVTAKVSLNGTILSVDF